MVREPRSPRADTLSRRWQGASPWLEGRFIAGAIAGRPVALLIIDDPIKDRERAVSPRTRSGQQGAGVAVTPEGRSPGGLVSARPHPFGLANETALSPSVGGFWCNVVCGQ